MIFFRWKIYFDKSENRFILFVSFIICPLMSFLQVIFHLSLRNMLLFDRMMLLSFVLDVAWAVQSLMLIPLEPFLSYLSYSPLRHSLYSLVWHLHDGMNLLCPDHHSFLELNLCDSYHKSTRWRLLWWWCCNRPWMRRSRCLNYYGRCRAPKAEPTESTEPSEQSKIDT